MKLYFNGFTHTRYQILSQPSGTSRKTVGQAYWHVMMITLITDMYKARLRIITKGRRTSMLVWSLDAWKTPIKKHKFLYLLTYICFTICLFHMYSVHNVKLFHVYFLFHKHTKMFYIVKEIRAKRKHCKTNIC